MQLKEAFEILELNEEAGYDAIYDSYQTHFKEVQNKYGLDSKEFEKEGLKYHTAFCLIMNTGKYDNEKFSKFLHNFFINYQSQIDNYDSIIKEIKKEV